MVCVCVTFVSGKQRSPGWEGVGGAFGKNPILIVRDTTRADVLYKITCFGVRASKTSDGVKHCFPLRDQ